MKFMLLEIFVCVFSAFIALFNKTLKIVCVRVRADFLREARYEKKIEKRYKTLG